MEGCRFQQCVFPFVNFSFCVLIVVYSKWPHNTGPMLTYMANCGPTPCNKFDISGAKWFKISQDGRVGSTWAQAGLSTFSKLFSPFNISFHHPSFSLVVTGGVAKSFIPKNLAPGNYLVRHEIIALHLATTKGLAEFYPACAQVKVGGSETGGPSPGDLVSIPGAYNDNDPGIFDPSVFDTSVPYVFPGPPIATFVDATTSGTPSKGNSSTPTTGTPPKSSTTSRKKCKLKNTSPTSSSVTNAGKRHFSRVIKRLNHYSSNTTNSPPR